MLSGSTNCGQMAFEEANDLIDSVQRMVRI